MNRQMALGLLFLTAFGVLAYYTLFLTDVIVFGSETLLEAEFPEAHGLREGDAVTVSGMRIGRVKSITYDPRAPREKRILVSMKLIEPLEVRDGYVVTIQETTLLGGRNIDIDPGPFEAPAVDQTVRLAGGIEPNPMDALRDAGMIFSENRARIATLLEDLRLLANGLRDGHGALGRLLSDEQLAAELTTGLQDFSSFSRSARALIERVEKGEGTLGRLFVEDELYTRVRNTAANIEAVTTDLRAGRGPLGRLFYDERLAAELDTTLSNLRTISDDLAAGRGTLGRLLKDEGIAVDIQRLTNDLAEGRGTLGSLFTSNELYEKLVSLSDDLAAVSSAIRNKEGSLGELIMDRELYDEVLSAVKLLNRSLEDYREAAPVSTFTSVFFGAF